MIKIELMGSITDAYRNGEPVSLIARDLSIDKADVIDTLLEYKKSQTHNKKYSDEFMRFVAERDCKEALRKDTQSELKVSRNFLIRAVEKYGKVYRSNVESEKEIRKVTREDDFKRCLHCDSKKVNAVDSNVNGSIVKGYYCLDCGSEFAIKGGRIFKINWENIN